MKQEYTIALDIGVASVGWAVLKDNDDLIKKKMTVLGNTEKKSIKKNFWGVRLFDSGKTAQERRLKRTNRRRIARRRNRILILQEIFSDDIQKIDTNFFQRLDESFLTIEDKKTEKYPIFGTITEETEYHEKFPTIYHLRKYLADTKKKADLRLVYLAMAHILKFRGHFLIEGTLNTQNTSIEETFKIFIKNYNQQFLEENEWLDNKHAAEAAVILNGSFSRTKKSERILSLFPSEKSNSTFAQFVKMIVGNQGKFKKAFGLEEDMNLQMTKEEYDTNLEELLGKIGDEFSDVFVAAKNTYDAVELSGILTTKDSSTNAKLSASMIERYDQHKTDLKKFKLFIKENLPEKYAEIFKNEAANGYAGFIDGKTKQEDFYKYIKKEISSARGAEYFLEKIEEESFLRKQRTIDNGVIPHQIHLEELSSILEQQSVY
ncbi:MULTISPECIES: type II CRISPR RNA-guided endonuclease Cas9 [unclassified Enterococcus]|uniref:type II CRISPR RNA-guided endonuclease Cas9 n=1 Tax=unclassified Enterococcus TaxID=2608891 RepID=UPI003D270EB4